MKNKRIYVERSLYYFTCTNCGRVNSQTFHKRKRSTGLCRKCRGPKAMNKNQISLLPLDNHITAD